MCIHQFTTLVIKLVFVAVAWLNPCTVVLMQEALDVLYMHTWK